MHEEFARLFKQAVGDVPAQEIAKACGSSLGYAYQLRNGQVPSREKLIAICDGLNIRGSRRAQLFALAGYDDPSAPKTVRGLRAEVLEVAREMEPLSPAELDIVRWLLEDRQRVKAVAALASLGVIYGDRAGSEALAVAR